MQQIPVAAYNQLGTCLSSCLRPETYDSLLFLFHVLSIYFIDAYIIVDGLDEFENRTTLLSLLLAIRSNSFHILVSTRHITDVARTLDSYPTIKIEGDIIEEDIATYVRSRFEAHDVNDPTYEKLKTAVVRKSEQRCNELYQSY